MLALGTVLELPKEPAEVPGWLRLLLQKTPFSSQNPHQAAPKSSSRASDAPVPWIDTPIHRIKTD